MLFKTLSDLRVLYGSAMKNATVFKVFCFWAVCCAFFSKLHSAPPPPPTPPPQYVPFSFGNVNNTMSGPFVYSNLYIVVKGTDPATGNACFVKFNVATGVGTCHDPISSTDNGYTYALSSFPVDGDNVPYVYMPCIISARLYMSIGSGTFTGLTLPVQGASAPYTIGDPIPTDPMDTAYNYLYDKVEFNIKPDECVINPTLVDYFCFPLPITVTANGGCSQLYAGMPPTQNREQIFSNTEHTGYADIVNSITNTASQAQWSGLLLKHGSKNLRILSTNTALGSAPVLFDTSYLLSTAYYNKGNDTWLSKFWFSQSAHNSYYTTNTIWMDLSQLPGYGLYSGQVNPTTGAFNFTKQTGTKGASVSITLPTSTVPFFAGTGFVSSGDAAAATIIEKFLSAGVVSGVLPTASSKTNPINNSFFQAFKSSYYQNNSYFAAGSGPWYDLYSKVLHSFAVYPYNFYTYAYDDVLGNDNTITSENILTNNVTVTITLGDMTGTTP